MRALQWAMAVSRKGSSVTPLCVVCRERPVYQDDPDWKLCVDDWRAVLRVGVLEIPAWAATRARRYERARARKTMALYVAAVGRAARRERRGW